MTPERWDRVGEVLEGALSVDATERSSYLDVACGGDYEVRREVESLLLSHQQAGSGFLNVTGAAAAPVLVYSNPKRLGRRIGPYLVEELIGHGGMGEVYAAVRADGQYEKRVALKLVRGGYDSGFILEKFRNERQILAALVHPNIAQLLDGGTTEDGVPYLVLELIDGTPIDVYCAEHDLSVSERLELFRQVCSAVQYAHQHLVIHRDIKPSNIFVTQDGAPKLLDFGIAKIMGDSGNAEATIFHPMTPEFASPEQVLGKPITTASDVYSLGVVLYRLLTGKSPYKPTTATVHEISRAVTDAEPVLPSAAVTRGQGSVQCLPDAASNKLQKRLRGDLDFILLKALRKEPERRYGSVDQFAEDIRRHIVGLPVHARRGTWSYRASKFVQRHRVSVVAATLISAALAAGAVVTLHEAKLADENRRRAERRFNDVRKLANSLMFEIHDSIRQLPGATAARKLIVERAQEYLDSLAVESKNDPSLLRELAAAYIKLAAVQGDALQANLGNSEVALRDYRKAVELLTVCRSLQPSNVDVQRELGSAYLDLSMSLLRAGDKKGSHEFVRKAVELLESTNRDYAGNAQIQAELGRAYERAGALAADENDLGGALRRYERSLTMHESVTRTNPSMQNLSRVSFAHKHIGSTLAVMNELDKALEHYRAALEIDEAQMKNDPGNVQTRYNVTYAYSDTGWILNKKGDSGAALRYYAKAMQIREQLAAADPQDVRTRRGLAKTYNYIGTIHGERKEYAEAVTYLRKALAIRRLQSEKDPSDQNQFDLAETESQLGLVYSAEAFEPRLRTGERRNPCAEAVPMMRNALVVFEKRKNESRLSGDDVGTPEALSRAIVKCDRLH